MFFLKCGCALSYNCVKGGGQMDGQELEEKLRGWEPCPWSLNLGTHGGQHTADNPRSKHYQSRNDDLEHFCFLKDYPTLKSFKT